ncbi:MAG: PQQ-dependent sugar dehydrogenase [Acidobacteriota bacterium]
MPRRRRSNPTLARTLVAGGLIAALTPFSPSAEAQPPADLELQSVTGSVVAPVAIRHADDGSGRIFIVEQGGAIKIFDGANLLATPFLDISALVVSGGEQGLLGLAFHPDYATNGHFFVNYTRSASPLDQTVVARYTVSAGNPNVADSASAVEILVVDQPFGNHNGGDIHFSPIDGYLYIGMGDGGGWDTAQDQSSLLGKMLRIDVDTPPSASRGGLCGLVGNYSVPASNPFVGTAEVCDEIWAIGLRNPWRWSFDRQTGDILIGDVGEGAREEVNVQPGTSAGGENYGWPCLEGTQSFQPSFCDGSMTLTHPALEYSHGGGECSVIGGFVYRGQDIPGLVGHYGYNDWCTGDTWFATQTSPGVWTETPWIDFPGFNGVGYGEDEQGEIYVAFGDEILRYFSASSANLIFNSGFESGNTGDWSTVFP